MEPLHITTTVYTLDEYLRFNRYSIWILNRQWIISMIFVALFIAFDIICNHTIVIGIIVSAFYLISSYFVTQRIAKKAYLSDRSGINVAATYHFYQNKVTELRDSGSYTFMYSDLYRICETKECYYLMLAKYKGITIIKRECTPELIAFIQELKRKYNK